MPRGIPKSDRKSFKYPANFVRESSVRKKGVSRYIIVCLCSTCNKEYKGSRQSVAKRKTTVCAACANAAKMTVEVKEKLSKAILKQREQPSKIYTFDKSLTPKERAKASSQRSRLWAVFRLTSEEVQAIQDYEAKHEKYKLLLGKHLGTDHCHKTGLIRGRLEFRLNKAYGLIENAFPENTAEVLRALADYHDNPPAIDALGCKKYGLIGKAQYKKHMVYGPPKDDDKTGKS